ncbi:hypothetical protein ACKKBG_A06370 [Auxenochlorella protothecoides x Auxenochlorella symbiontica]
MVTANGTAVAKRQRTEEDGQGAKDLRDRLQEARKALPVYSARHRLVEVVRTSPCLVLVGETGSGKTTQVPRLLLEAGLAAGGAIACTQPRRIAAVTVAQRVANEMGCKLGSQVGYCVRFDDRTGPDTRIKYMTDGMLLREALLDPLLQRYKVVILDEAHERTVATDVLLGLLKAASAGRPEGDLRLVVMSATLDTQKLTAYFQGSQAAYIAGRQYPVQVMYTPAPEESYVDAAITTALQIHCEEGPGDVLVFLTGQDEIEACERLLTDRAASLPPDPARLSLCVLPLYAALPPEAQLRVFERAAPGSRRVVLATNIAETSVTVPGVRFVVDSGMVKARAYSPRLGADCLQVVPVSQAQARQRSGRAGREGPGKAFRLYTEAAFAKLAPSTAPEILRTNLSSVVLQLKALGVRDVLGFDFLDPPPAPALVRSLELLLALGALTREGDLAHPIGTSLARLPVDPMFGRVLMASAELGCSEEALAVIAMASTDPVFQFPREKREEAAAAHARFASREGDHLTALAVFQRFVAQPRKQAAAWCREGFLNARSLAKARDIHAQLRGHFQALGLRLASCGDDATPLRQALVMGLFSHAARRQPGGTYRVLATGQDVALHPSSALARAGGARSGVPAVDAVVFGELVRTTRTYARDVTAIDINWLPQLVPNFFARATAAGG